MASTWVLLGFHGHRWEAYGTGSVAGVKWLGSACTSRSSLSKKENESDAGGRDCHKASRLGSPDPSSERGTLPPRPLEGVRGGA